jgi:hypothetical protein
MSEAMHVLTQGVNDAKAEWVRLGGLKNTELYRKQKASGQWTYWRSA